MPGGPDQVIFNPHLDAAGRAALRARFGLDDPLPVQYLKWLGNCLVGNFGFSFVTNQPVSTILMQRFPPTLELFGLALLLAHSIPAYLIQLEFAVDRGKIFWGILGFLSVWPAGVLVEAVRGLIKQRVSKTYRENKAILEMKKQYAFFDNHLTMNMPHYHVEAGYARYVEAKESKSSFYLKVPEGEYVQLPKKCFTEEQITALRALFAEKFGKRFKQYNQKQGEQP